MAEKIDEIVSGLAGIRSGLSVISQNRDNIDELREKGEKWKQKIQDRKEEHRRAYNNRQALSTNASDIDREINTINSKINEVKASLKKAQGEYEEAKKNAAPDHGNLNMFSARWRTCTESVENANIRMFPSLTVNLIFIIAALVGSYIYWYINITNETFVMDQLYKVIIPVNLVYPVACILVYGIRHLIICIKNPEYKKFMQFIKSRPDEYKRIIWNLEDVLSEYQVSLENAMFNKQENAKEIKKSANGIQQEENAMQAFIDKAKYEIEVINDEIRKLTNRSKAIKQALVDSYSSLLSPADWQHIDVIMYYLETHRADSIKEALNIIDSKLQFEQLTQVVVSSAEAVCGYIQNGFIKLNNNLIKSHEMIMDKISDVEYKIDRNAELISATSQMLAKGIDKQISAAELNNALVKKAHKQIGELLNDMEVVTKVDVTVNV